MQVNVMIILYRKDVIEACIKGIRHNYNIAIIQSFNDLLEKMCLTYNRNIETVDINDKEFELIQKHLR